MNVTITEEQTMLQDSVKKFVENDVPLEKVRELFDEPNGLSDELWAKIAEQGWLGILVPEEYGGLGMGVQELAVVCEELGRGAVPGPYRSTVLAAHLIALAGTDAAKKSWLEGIVAGTTRATLALIEDTPEIDLSRIETKAVSDNGGYLLNGKKMLVADAMGADLFVVAARKDDGSLAFFPVERGAGGRPNQATKPRGPPRARPSQLRAGPHMAFKSDSLGDAGPVDYPAEFGLARRALGIAIGARVEFDDGGANAVRRTNLPPARLDEHGHANTGLRQLGDIPGQVVACAVNVESPLRRTLLAPLRHQAHCMGLVP